MTGFVVSGPGEQDRRQPNAGAALSLAITFACRAAADSSFYVRDAAGDVVHRVDREAGTVHVRTTERGRP